MTSEKKLNVFILSTWYPSKNDLFFGYFVQQAASYLSDYVNITVLNVNNRTNNTQVEELISTPKNGFTEITFQCPISKIRFINSLKTLYYIRKAYKKAVSLNGKPDVMHLQVLSVLLWFVYFMGIFHKIPFVVSEHWSKYFNSNTNFAEKLKYKIQNCLLKRASACTVVSKQLEESMRKKGFKAPFSIVPNLVDPNLFDIIETSKTKTFVHISCFDEKIKNITGVISAVEQLKKERNDFELILIGNGPDFDKILDLIKFKNLNNIRLTGAIESLEVNKFLNQSCALVMNSYKETFGIPIVESWMCGRPVISTPVGIANDIHPEGYIIKTGFDDTDSIVNAMKIILDKPFNKSDSEAIRKYAVDNYGKEKAIKMYLDIYQNSVRKIK